MKMSDYMLDDIFEKNLLFLLPFYIFNLESSFKHPKKGEDYLTKITDDFKNIKKKLDKMLSEKHIDELLRILLRDYINGIVNKIAINHDDVKRRLLILWVENT